MRFSGGTAVNCGAIADGDAQFVQSATHLYGLVESRKEQRQRQGEEGSRRRRRFCRWIG